jgi:hypothetical protein
MAKTKTVTGVDGAIVNVKPIVPSQPPGQVFLRRGDELPGNLIDGEVERLTGLGVFNDPAAPPVAAVAAAARITALEAELAAANARTEAAERAAAEVTSELNAAKKTAPASAKKAEPPNPANATATPAPTPR